MSRRRPERTPGEGVSPHRDAPYWPHSNPDDPDDHTATVGRSSHDGDDPCPGPCNRPFRAAEAAALDQAQTAAIERRRPHPTIIDHDTPMHPGRPVWCVTTHRTNERGEVVGVIHTGCVDLIREDLNELGDLAATLTPGPLNTPRDVKVDDRPNGSARTLVTSPSPSPGWDEADDLIRWAVALEDGLRARLGHPPNRAPVRYLATAARYLGAYFTPLMAGPDAAQVGREIMGRRRRLTKSTGRDGLVHRVDGLCLRCDSKALERRDGDDLVQCRACRATWDWTQFEFLARGYAEDVRKTGA